MYLPWISFLLALLLDLQSMPEKNKNICTSENNTECHNFTSINELLKHSNGTDISPRK